MSNELEQRALENAADDHDRRHTLTPTPQVVGGMTVADLRFLLDGADDSWPVMVNIGAAEHDAPIDTAARSGEYGVSLHVSTPDVDVLAEVRACGAVWVCHEAEWSDNAYAGTWTCALPLSHGGPHVELTQGIRWHEHGRWSDDLGEFYPPNALLDREAGR